MHTEEDFSTPDEGSYFVGLLVGGMTVVLCLLFGYGLEVSLNQHSPTGVGGSFELLILLAVVATPIAEVFIFAKRGKRKSAIGVGVSCVAILGCFFMVFACLAGWVCHGSGRW